MQVLILVHFFVNEIKTLRKGYFKVNPYKYKLNPDETAAEVAKQWIRELRKEYSYRIEVFKVLYDENDITDLAKD